MVPPVQALVAWMQRHARVLTIASSPSGEALGPSLPEQIEELHSAEATPEQQPQYWPLVQRLVALGWAEDAIGHLGLHSAWQLAYGGSKNQQMLSLVRPPHAYPTEQIYRESSGLSLSGVYGGDQVCNLMAGCIIMLDLLVDL